MRNVLRQIESLCLFLVQGPLNPFWPRRHPEKEIARTFAYEVHGAFEIREEENWCRFQIRPPRKERMLLIIPQNTTSDTHSRLVGKHVDMERYASRSWHSCWQSQRRGVHNNVRWRCSGRNQKRKVWNHYSIAPKRNSECWTHMKSTVVRRRQYKLMHTY